MAPSAATHNRRYGSLMKYQNLDMKIDQFVAYVNSDKINLIPSFQRGHVWKLPTRRKLIANVVNGRPIPAIFLYKEASGGSYDYNILDGKQRLESLILFIGDQRPALKINSLHKYFFQKRHRDAANFWIEIDGKKQKLESLTNELFREFQEYVIPTIEITLSEDDPSSLDEIIDLFVDINSYGEKVKRFDIVKAMSKDALLAAVFNLLARKEQRKKDVLYKGKHNDFTKVLKTLQTVANIQDKNSKVDRMWELLVEISLFLRTKVHRNPVEILKSFIRATKEESQDKVTTQEEKELRSTFRFLVKAYKNQDLVTTRLATNQIHFYTMTTSIISKNLLTTVPEDELIRKLAAFGQVLDEKIPAPTKEIKGIMRNYRELSEKQTTHVGRRAERENKFIEAIEGL